MSRAPYQRMSGNGDSSASSSNARAASSSSAALSNQKSPKEAEAAERHRARNTQDVDDPQAPWKTFLEYSVDPLLWEDDMKHKACPLCSSPFVASLMGSGRHHCRMCGILCCGSCSRGALDLPGYDSGSERVCEPCRKRVLGLRTWLNKNQEVMINNVPINREAVQFTIYRGSTPWSTPLWLSQSLLLVMYLDSSGQMDGVPVHQIESVTVGFATRELLKRKEKTVMCCVSSVDEAFAQKEPCLFSLQLTDGRTIDLEADTPQLRNEWVDKLKGLIASTSSFVQYHFEVAQYRVSELLKREKDRLSPAAIKKMVDKAQAEKRQGRNQESDKIRQKYAKRQG